jgi:adenosine kinase
VNIVVTGSIATDHLMHFPGRFADHLLADQLHAISLSFLVDDLVIRRGGVGANIAYGLGVLGLRPALAGAVGPDFADYREWLEQHGVDCESVHVSETAHTARFTCTTDDEMCQIASFYAGAMAEASAVEIAPIAERLGGVDFVLIGANDPTAMLRHSQECRDRGYPFIADPSQQLTSLSREQIRELIDGAAYLFTNEYEKGLLESTSGLSADEVLDRVETRVTTLGAGGVRIDQRGAASLHVPVAQEQAKADPTGVGDAFRAGFFAATGWGLGLERSAQVGSLLAAYVLETVGTQEYEIKPETFVARLAESYGADAADDVAPHLL